VATQLKNSFDTFIDFISGQVFDDRLRCNTQCKRKKDPEEKKECEEQFCKEIVIEKKGSKEEDKDSEVSISNRLI